MSLLYMDGTRVTLVLSHFRVTVFMSSVTLSWLVWVVPPVLYAAGCHVRITTLNLLSPFGLVRASLLIAPELSVY